MSQIVSECTGHFVSFIMLWLKKYTSMTQTNTDNSNNLTSVPSEDLDQPGHHPGGLHENTLRSQLPNERTAD